MYTASGGLCAVGMWPFCFRTIKQKGYKWQICKINHTLFGLKNQCVGDWFFFPENQWRKVRTFGDQPTKPNGQAKPSSQTAKLLNSKRNNVLNKKGRRLNWNHYRHSLFLGLYTGGIYRLPNSSIAPIANFNQRPQSSKIHSPSSSTSIHNVSRFKSPKWFR